MPADTNSFHRIVHSYFAAVTKEPFTYGLETIKPKRLIVSPLLFRGFRCSPLCGACCQRYSLEFLPSDVKPCDAEKHFECVNGVIAAVYRINQDDKHQHCSYLNTSDGDCTIHNEKPFHCDFEMLRPLIGKDRVKWIQKLPGRHWCMQRIPGQGRGALCKLTKPSPESTREVIRKLKRLKEWTDHFRLDTWLPEMIEWAARGPHNKSLILVSREESEKSLEITHE